MKTATQVFFDDLSPDYEGFIRRAVARYDEMFWAMFYYLPQNFQPTQVLELGCGTGNLTQRIVEKWPNAQVKAVDISSEMIGTTQKRLPHANIEFVNASFQDLDFEPNSLDVVMSNLAVHHILDDDKQALIQKIYSWLKPGGVFVLSDQLRGMNDYQSQIDWELCESQSLKNGATPEEVAFIKDHVVRYDNPATLSDNLRWFNEAGYEADVHWRYCFWMVLHGRKPLD